MRTIAILCGGGPAPGINTVVATVTKVFLKDGFRVLAIHEGYKGLFAVHPEVEELTYEKADQIYSRGGSAIKMSRFKPEDQDFTTALFVKEGIELLVTIGGDDPPGCHGLFRRSPAGGVSHGGGSVSVTANKRKCAPAGAHFFTSVAYSTDFLP